MSIAVDGGALRAPSRISEFFGGFMRRIMVAQMRTALNQLSDTQLEQIGITRADIPRRAVELIDKG